MISRRLLSKSALVVGLLFVPAIGAAKLTAMGTPRVVFHATGPAGLRIDGTSSDLRVDDQGEVITITVPLANFDTGIALRNKHMREKYLEVARYPNAVFSSARSAVRLPAPGQRVRADAPGTLVIHGTSRPAIAHYELSRDGGTYAVAGTIHVNMNEFGIETPGYLGVRVKPDVDVEVHFDAVDR